MSKKCAVGVVVGMSSSRVANKEDVIVNAAGKRETATFVAFQDKDKSPAESQNDAFEVIIGPSAARLTRHFPKRVVPGNLFLSILGRLENDPFLSSELNCTSAGPALAESVSDEEDGDNEKTESGAVVAALDIGGARKSGSAVLSEMLSCLTQTAAAKCGSTPEALVVGVPSHVLCGTHRLAAVRKAIERCDVEFSHVCPAPLLACLPYGLDVASEKSQRPQKVVVVYLGGHSLRVSMVHLFRGMMRLEASVCDRRIGGKTFDDTLYAFVKRQMLGGDDGASSSLKSRLVARARSACVEAKHRLSVRSCKSTDLLVEGGLVKTRGDLKLRLSKLRYQSMMRGLIDRCVRSVKTTVSGMLPAGTDESILSHVVLCGGAMMMPQMQDALVAAYGNDRVLCSVSPDEVVVRGAGMQADIVNKLRLSGKTWTTLHAHAPSPDAGNILVRVPGILESIVRASCLRPVNFSVRVAEKSSGAVEVWEDDCLLARLPLVSDSVAEVNVESNTSVRVRLSGSNIDTKVYNIERAADAKSRLDTSPLTKDEGPLEVVESSNGGAPEEDEEVDVDEGGLSDLD